MRDSMIRSYLARSLGTIAAISALALTSIPCMASPPAPAQSAAPAGTIPHLALFRVSNDTGNPSYEAACNAATDSLAITLRQLGLYELLPTEARLGARDIDSLRAWAESHNADYILYGSIGAASGGQLSCGLSLFDRAKGKVSLARQSEKVAPLDVFDAEDGLILDMLDAMTGRHLGFGSLAFANKGVKGSYRVYLDGAELGSDLAGMDKVLAGPHTVRIVQRRMLGELELARRDLVVGEGESAELSFTVPALTDEERARLEGLESSSRANWKDPAASGPVDRAVADYLDLTRDSSYSPAIADYAKRAKQLSAEWSVMRNRNEILDAAWAPESESLDESIAAFLTAKSCPDPEAVRSKVRENALLLATFLEIKSAKAALDADYAASSAAMASILDFARYLPEDRTSEYTFAASRLKEIIDGGKSQPEAAAGAERLFGGRLESAKRFYELKGQGMAVDCLAEAGVPGSGSADFAPFGRPLGGAPKGKCLLVVESEPAKAIVLIDGEEPRYTPFTVELEPGAHSFSSIAAYLDNTYYDEIQTQWITLPPGETVRLPLKLKPSPARLSFSMVPEGYAVSLDGARLGETPLPEMEIAAGNRSVHLEAPGRDPVDLAVTALPGQRAKVPWGTNWASAIKPVKKTIKLDAKPDSWEGILPVYESDGETTFMGFGDYGISRLFICCDDRNLYWRVDFNKLCPLDKLPPGLKSGVTIELAFARSDGNANYNVAFSRKDNRYETWATLWNQPRRQSTNLDEGGPSSIRWRQGPGILVASVPLEKVLKNTATFTTGTISVANYGETDWDSYWQSTRIFFDFSAISKR